MKRVAMIGCGKLGLPCAEEMAKAGHDVKGFDVNDFNSELIKSCNSIETTVQDREIIFIAVPTPHCEEYDGSFPTSHLPPKDFNYSIVTDVLDEVNKFVNNSQLVVLISTVLPGTTRSKLIKHITNARFVYNPYLIAMGTVAWDMINPEMIIIGTQDGSETGDSLELVSFYNTMMQNLPKYVTGTWDEAESIKIFYNTFISAKLGLVNMIQDVAQKLNNINVDVVTNALASADQRITGPKYMTAGMGDGGACHPRDNIALRWLAEEYNLGYDMFGAIMDAREKQARNMANFLCSFEMPVVIVGTSYKPGVPYTDGSPSLLVGSFITDRPLFYVDQYDRKYARGEMPEAPSVFLLAHNYDVTYFKQKAGIDNDDFLVNILKKNAMSGSVVVDPWRKMPKDKLNGITIVHYGNTRDC